MSTRQPMVSRWRSRLSGLSAGAVLLTLAGVAAAAEPSARSNVEAPRGAAVAAVPAAAGRLLPREARETPRPVFDAVAPEQASFVVRVIEASRADASVDPRLEDMRRELKPFDGRFSRFALISEASFALAAQSSREIALPGGAQFILQFLGLQSGKVQRVRYQATMPGGKTTRSVASGARTLDAIQNGEKLTIVSTLVR